MHLFLEGPEAREVAPMGAKTEESPVTESPVYWFVVLEQARASGDFERAAQAKRELERLGIRIHYGKRPQRGIAGV